jgi:hypothetical protein
MEQDRKATEQGRRGKAAAEEGAVVVLSPRGQVGNACARNAVTRSRMFVGSVAVSRNVRNAERRCREIDLNKVKIVFVNGA